MSKRSMTTALLLAFTSLLVLSTITLGAIRHRHAGDLINIQGPCD